MFTLCPPRIIRNSDRPRASNRTMITTQTSLALAKSLRLDGHCRHRQGNQTKGKPSRVKSLSKSGHAPPDSELDIETQVLSSSGRGRSFFLTSLFIELIDSALSVSAFQEVQTNRHKKLSPGSQPRITPACRYLQVLGSLPQTCRWL